MYYYVNYNCLRKQLVNTSTSHLPTPGNSKCNNKQCKCCQQTTTGKTFKSQVKGESTLETTSHERKKICISCRKCGLQYVREMENTLHIRMNRHCSDIRTKKTEKPVAAHFCQLDHIVEDLQVRGIEKIHRSSTQWRGERDSFILRTLSSHELNLGISFSANSLCKVAKYYMNTNYKIYCCY